MASIACNLCGADDFSVRFEAGVAQHSRIVVCNRCSLMYANPRAEEPDYTELKARDPDAMEKQIAQGMRLAKESLQVRDYSVTRQFLAARFPKRGKLLEVGSGLGYLLDYFRQDGWDVSGVEPNAGFSSYAQKALGLTISTDLLHEAGLPDSSYDAVLMMHVIEHVPDPHALLAEIFRVLKPGGMLVMETPRYDTLTFKLLGRRERSLSCNGHIYFFTSKTLREVSEKAGFVVSRADKVGRSLTLGRLAYNVGVIARSRKLSALMQSSLQRLGLKNAAIMFNLRDMERMYLTKPEQAAPPRATVRSPETVA